MIKVKQYNIPAGGTLTNEFGGTYFVLMQGSETLNVQLFESSSQVSDIQGIQSGLRLGPFKEPFTKFSAETVSGAAGTITVGIADEPMEFLILGSSVSISPLPLAVTTAGSKLKSTADLAVVGAAAAVQVLPASATRRTAILTVKASSAGTARFGDNAIGAAQGVEIGVGQAITLETTDAIYVYSAAGATITMLEIDT